MTYFFPLAMQKNMKTGCVASLKNVNRIELPEKATPLAFSMLQKSIGSRKYNVMQEK